MTYTDRTGIDSGAARAAPGSWARPGPGAGPQPDELLQELRVAITGVQILFAFLLGLAFTTRFTSLDGCRPASHALVTDGAATLVLIAPVCLRPAASSGAGRRPR